MLEQNVIHHNGHLNGIHLNGVATPAYARCPSDYPEVPAPEPTPAPIPGWRNQFPTFTHYIEWRDSDGRKHGLTVRTDDRAELLDTLRSIKPASPTKTPTQEEGVKTPAETQPDVQRCAIHGVDMPHRWSKRTNGHYFAHKMADGSFCYGRAKS